MVFIFNIFCIFFIFSLEIGENENIFKSSMVWSDEKWLGSRANFHLEAYPANLRVDNVQVLDSGQYRCRVDFTEAPTQNTIVNLTIIGNYFNFAIDIYNYMQKLSLNIQKIFFFK